MAKASIFHEAPLEILHLAPNLVLELLQAAQEPFLRSDVAGSEKVEVVVADSHLSEPLPHLRAADFVAIVRSNDREQCVVVEVQRSRVAGKKRVWPYYVTHLDLRLGMPVVLIVLTFDDGVARWARTPSIRGSMSFAPLVLGPADFRSIGEEDSPAILTLKALVDLATLEKPRDDRERERAEGSVLAVVRQLLLLAPSPARKTFVNLIHGTAGPRFRATLETLLEGFGMGALELIKQEGRKEGRDEGRKEGRDEGRSESVEKLREALKRVLTARGLLPSSERHAQIEAAGTDELLVWLERAALATRVENVFEIPSRR